MVTLPSETQWLVPGSGISITLENGNLKQRRHEEGSELTAQ